MHIFSALEMNVVRYLPFLLGHLVWFRAD